MLRSKSGGDCKIFNDSVRKNYSEANLSHSDWRKIQEHQHHVLPLPSHVTVQDELCCNKFAIGKMNKKMSKTMLTCSIYCTALQTLPLHIPRSQTQSGMLFLLPHKASGTLMEVVFWVWDFFAFNLRFAVRIFKVGLAPENNQRRVWLHSQPHPEQHSNFTVSTKMKTDTARSSFRHKQGKGWALQWNKGFPFQAKTP